MEVRIGVIYSPKELTLEIEGAPEPVVAQIDKAQADALAMLWLHDDKGRRVGVPVDKIAYVEIATDDGARRVGFAR
jgi:hypothetical protein